MVCHLPQLGEDLLILSHWNTECAIRIVNESRMGFTRVPLCWSNATARMWSSSPSLLQFEHAVLVCCWNKRDEVECLQTAAPCISCAWCPSHVALLLSVRAEVNTWTLTWSLSV